MLCVTKYRACQCRSWWYVELPVPLKKAMFLLLLVSTYRRILRIREVHILIRETMSSSVARTEVSEHPVTASCDRNWWNKRNNNAICLKERISNYPNLFPIPVLVWLQKWLIFAVHNMHETGVSLHVAKANKRNRRSKEGDRRVMTITHVTIPHSCRGTAM